VDCEACGKEGVAYQREFSKKKEPLLETGECCVCVCVCVFPPNNLLTALSIIIKLGINARCQLRPCFEFVESDGQDI
jgi:hypothetical protein